MDDDGDGDDQLQVRQVNKKRLIAKHRDASGLSCWLQISGEVDLLGQKGWGGGRGERERLFGSRERDGKLKITFPFYRKGTGIRKCYGKGREI